MTGYQAATLAALVAALLALLIISAHPRTTARHGCAVSIVSIVLLVLFVAAWS